MSNVKKKVLIQELRKALCDEQRHYRRCAAAYRRVSAEQQHTLAELHYFQGLSVWGLLAEKIKGAFN